MRNRLVVYSSSCIISFIQAICKFFFFQTCMVFISLAKFRPKDSLISTLDSIQGAIVTESKIKCIYYDWKLI